MAAVGTVTDTTGVEELFGPQKLHMKPIARLNVSVQLPQLKTPGKSISNWEVMEKLKKMIKPDEFLYLKVAKSAMDFIRFEGEIDSKSNLVNVIGKLDTKTIKLGGFSETLKVRAAEAKPSFPARHDWESFFRDAKNMNEMKPGERPDTIHLSDLPCKWFANRKDSVDKPSEFVLRKVFETYGDVRCVDIPMLDPYRKEYVLKDGQFQTFTFGQDLYFDAYVQFKEYISFVKAMTALRGMKLVHYNDDGKAFAATIKVDFDKTKHLSDKNIRKRRIEREHLMQLEKEREERIRKEREEEERRKEEERCRIEAIELEKRRKKEEKTRRKIERRRHREEKRRLKKLEEKRREEERQMQLKIKLEERRILIAQRKLETIRLLSELFNRIKIIKQAEEVELREREVEDERRRQVELEGQRRVEEEKRKLELERRKAAKLQRQEQDLRERILKNMRLVKQRQQEKNREELREKIRGKKLLASVAVAKKN